MQYLSREVWLPEGMNAQIDVSGSCGLCSNDTYLSSATTHRTEYYSNFSKVRLFRKALFNQDVSEQRY